MFQFFERTINWIVSWTKWSIVTQEFINVTTHYFVSHLLSNVGLDVTLADTANIAFHTPWDLLCQSAVNQRQIMLDGHTHRRLLDPSWPSQTGRNGWPLYRSTKEWKRCQVPGAEKTTHEWLRARFIFLIVCWQKWRFNGMSSHLMVASSTCHTHRVDDLRHLQDRAQ